MDLRRPGGKPALPDEGNDMTDLQPKASHYVDGAYREDERARQSP
jgi:hypothetical protein